MAEPTSLTHDRVRQIEGHWRKRRWIALAGLLGMLVAGFGAVSYGKQWAANDRIAEDGLWVPATIYRSDSGRYSTVHLEYEFDGLRYRDEIESGFFSRTSTRLGDAAIVIIDPEDPGFARTPTRRNINMLSRLLSCVTPFAFVLVWLAYGALYVQSRFNGAIWFRGQFEIKKTGGGQLRATLWDEAGTLFHTQNKMQGRVRSGRPMQGCYFALLGRFVMVVQDGDPEGVLVPCKGELTTETLTPVPVANAVDG